ncbi:hypothetical protein HID58_065710 [Brassica napus]|uniref:Uncharacterized protein n=1 Tax=Brassica napus TaxID=3708 RepID=A0ABQ7ZE26_BRANA|nr:hypothetical protein HID58_065710 [Brassica napus]
MYSLRIISEYYLINGNYCSLSADLAPKLSLRYTRNSISGRPPPLSMSDNLHEAIGAMSIRDDDPIDLPDNPCFSVFEENATSLLGRLLNPPNCPYLREKVKPVFKEVVVSSNGGASNLKDLVGTVPPPGPAVPPGFSPMFPQLAEEERNAAL